MTRTHRRRDADSGETKAQRRSWSVSSRSGFPNSSHTRTSATPGRYQEFVDRVARREQELGLGSALAEAVARYLYKLMAYKDEYEVARLSLDPSFAQSVREQVGEGAAITWRLHPPALRAMGLKKKLALGSWFRPFFGVLRSMRRLRGTPFDPFGRDEIRKLERQLIVEYRALIERELQTLSAESHARAVALAKLPDMIRGYEGVKRKNVERFRAAVLTT